MEHVRFNMRKGFTLVEILVVIGVIAILMGVSLFGLAGSRETARDARRKSDLEAIRAGLELYRADCRFYPASLAVGDKLVGDGSSAGCSGSNVYISEVPGDPVASLNYPYTRLTNFTYEICASLEGDGSGTVVTCTGSCGSNACNYRTTNP